LTKVRKDFFINSRSVNLVLRLRKEFQMWVLSMVVVLAASSPPPQFDPRPLFEAIRQVETGGETNPEASNGDGGASIGPYQIQRSYWSDAVDHDPSLVANGQTYQNVRDAAYAERVILAYWSRYAKSWDNETLARIHNGGPKGHRKAATLKYWAKVQKELRQ
jgi:hypothetical protein